MRDKKRMTVTVKVDELDLEAEQGARGAPGGGQQDEQTATGLGWS